MGYPADISLSHYSAQGHVGLPQMKHPFQESLPPPTHPPYPLPPTCLEQAWASTDCHYAGSRREVPKRGLTFLEKKHYSSLQAFPSLGHALRYGQIGNVKNL